MGEMGGVVLEEKEGTGEMVAAMEGAKGRVREVDKVVAEKMEAGVAMVKEGGTGEVDQEMEAAMARGSGAGKDQAAAAAVKKAVAVAVAVLDTLLSSAAGIGH